LSGTFRSDWRLMLGPSFPWPVGLGVGLIVLVVAATVGVPAAQHNLRNLTLIKHAPITSDTGLPTCSGEQSLVSPATTEDADASTALFLARSAMLSGACTEALTRLDGVQTVQAARLRASICLAQAAYECVQRELSSGSPHSEDALLWLGQHGERLASTGDTPSALRVFELARLFGELPRVQRREYAELLLANGQSEASIDVLRAAIRDVPDDADLHDALAGALWAVRPGDQGAITEAEQAVRLRDYFPYHYRLGLFYLSDGRDNDADAQFQRVLASGAARPDALDALGLIASRQGRLADAARYYAQSLQEADRPATATQLQHVCTAIEQTQQERPGSCNPR
jgi:tetratricopeptide (TPR) repeat protein